MPHRYPAEVRFQVIEPVRSGTKVAQLAETFGMSDATIYNWLKIYRCVVLDAFMREIGLKGLLMSVIHNWLGSPPGACPRGTTGAGHLPGPRKHLDQCSRGSTPSAWPPTAAAAPTVS